MSIEIFKNYIDDDDISGLTTFKYARQHKKSLLKIIDTDVYSLILTCIYEHDLSKFIKSNYEWRYIQKINVSFVNFVNRGIKMTKKNLEPERMHGLTFTPAYFGILTHFLHDYDVHEIPESFVKHYESLSDKQYFIYIAKYFSNTVEDIMDDLWKDKFNSDINLKPVHLFLLFLEKYDSNIDTQCYSSTTWGKDDIYHSIRDFFYDDVNVTENNIVELSLDYLRQHKKKSSQVEDEAKERFLINVVDFFEWMRLDDQIEFWDIVISIESIRHDVLRLIEYVLFHTTSEVFIDYAFEKYDQLQSEHGVMRITFTDICLTPCTKYFFQKVATLYPHVKDSIIIRLIHHNNDMLSTVFPGLTDQDIIFALKNKFL